MNILCVGDKLPMQRGFFKNNAGDLLPALSFLGRLYNTVFLVPIIYLPKFLIPCKTQQRQACLNVSISLTNNSVAIKNLANGLKMKHILQT